MHCSEHVRVIYQNLQNIVHSLLKKNSNPISHYQGIEIKSKNALNITKRILNFRITNKNNQKRPDGPAERAKKERW